MSLLRLITFRPQQEPAGPWTPARISTALWLDADASDTITLNGTTISEWSDKKGNLITVSQSTPSAQPTLALNSLNGKPTLSFDGSDGLLSVAGALQLSSFVIFVAYKITNRNAVICGVSHATPHSSPWFRWVIYPLNNNVIEYRIDGSVVQGGIQNSNFNILSLSTGNTEAFLNGNNVLSGINRTITYPTAQPFLIGQNSSNGGRMVGNIAEIVIVSGSISTENRLKMEGYLAHKWGLTANLPVDHPYKITPP